MFKSQLQEFAQKAGLPLPVYESVHEGPSHKPMFKASVCINGKTYESTPGFATLKAAQHAAAKEALDELLQSGCGAGLVPNPLVVQMFKCQLQEFAQKAGFLQPEYESLKEGPSHKPMFKASVYINGNKYESAPGFATLKEAQHAAAKAALDALLLSGCGAGVVPSPVHESGLCKNVLQQHAQKSNLSRPIYRTVKSGQENSLTFTTTVDIGGIYYSGGPAKNRKESEIKAARTALIAIQAQSYFAQTQLGSSNIISSSLPRTGKRGRDLRDGMDKVGCAKVKKELLQEHSRDSETMHDSRENIIQLEDVLTSCHEGNIKHQLTGEKES